MSSLQIRHLPPLVYPFNRFNFSQYSDQFPEYSDSAVSALFYSADTVCYCRCGGQSIQCFYCLPVENKKETVKKLITNGTVQSSQKNNATHHLQHGEKVSRSICFISSFHNIFKRNKTIAWSFRFKRTIFTGKTFNNIATGLLHIEIIAFFRVQ